MRNDNGDDSDNKHRLLTLESPSNFDRCRSNILYLINHVRTSRPIRVRNFQYYDIDDIVAWVVEANKPKVIKLYTALHETYVNVFIPYANKIVYMTDPTTVYLKTHEHDSSNPIVVIPYQPIRTKLYQHPRNQTTVGSLGYHGSAMNYV